MSTSTSQRAVDRAKQRQKIDDGINEEVLRALLAQPRGRRWLWLRLSDTNCFSQTPEMFAQGGFGRMCFAEGKRSLGLRLMADIQRVSPNDFVKMLVENSPVKLKDEDNDGSDDDDGLSPIDSSRNVHGSPGGGAGPYTGD